MAAPVWPVNNPFWGTNSIVLPNVYNAIVNQNINTVNQSSTLPHTMDARVWAAEFKKRYPDIDEDLMLAWFASAIMAGYDEATRRYEEKYKGIRILTIDDIII